MRTENTYYAKAVVNGVEVEFSTNKFSDLQEFLRLYGSPNAESVGTHWELRNVTDGELTLVTHLPTKEAAEEGKRFAEGVNREFGIEDSVKYSIAEVDGAIERPYITDAQGNLVDSVDLWKDLMQALKDNLEE